MARTQERDVIDLLLEQHEEIRALFVRVANAQGRERQEAFEELVRLLAVHETAEEEVVHPVARREIDQGNQIVEERLEEESDAKQALSELYDLGVDHPEFGPRLQELAEEVNRHATNEETEEFEALRQHVAPEQLQRMVGAVRTAESIAPTRPHPAAGESAMANLLAGPPLAMFDRVQDAIRDWQKRNE